MVDVDIRYCNVLPNIEMRELPRIGIQTIIHVRIGRCFMESSMILMYLFSFIVNVNTLVGKCSFRDINNIYSSLKENCS